MTVINPPHECAANFGKFRSRMWAPDPETLSGDFKAVYTYWDSLRDGTFAPPWSRFDWVCLPLNLIPGCSVVDVTTQPADFIYRFWGTERTSIQGADYTGKSVFDFKPKAIAEKSIREYREVISRKSALLVDTHCPGGSWTKPFDYQFLRLPFSDDGSAVNQILSIGHFDPTTMQLVLKYYEAEPARSASLERILESLDVFRPVLADS